LDSLLRFVEGTNEIELFLQRLVNLSLIIVLCY